MRTSRLLAAGITVAIGLTGGLATGSAQAVAAPTITQLEGEASVYDRGTIVVDNARASGGKAVDWISHRDWLRYDNVTFSGSTYATLCFIAVGAQDSAKAVATVEVRLGSRWAPPIQTFTIRNHLPEGTRTMASSAVAVPDGTHTVYLTIRSDHRWSWRLFVLDYLQWSYFPPPPTLSC